MVTMNIIHYQAIHDFVILIILAYANYCCAALTMNKKNTQRRVEIYTIFLTVCRSDNNILFVQNYSDPVI